VTGHFNLTSGSRSNTHGFHAYAEVYIGGTWFTTDARFHGPASGAQSLIGQNAGMERSLDIYGGATLTYFQVLGHQVAHGSVGW